jgi:hypothetical protein
MVARDQGLQQLQLFDPTMRTNPEQLKILTYGFNVECKVQKLAGIAQGKTSLFFFVFSFSDNGNAVLDLIERLDTFPALWQQNVVILPQSVWSCRSETLYTQSRDLLEDGKLHQQLNHLPPNRLLRTVRKGVRSYEHAFKKLTVETRERSEQFADVNRDPIPHMEGFLVHMSDDASDTNMVTVGDFWDGELLLNPAKWQQKNRIVAWIGRQWRDERARYVSTVCDDHPVGHNLEDAYREDAKRNKYQLFGSYELKTARTLVNVENKLYAVSLAGLDPQYLIVRQLGSVNCVFAPWKEEDPKFATRGFMSPKNIGKPKKKEDKKAF